MSFKVFTCVVLSLIAALTEVAHGQQLRYQMKPDQVVGYNVTITAITPTSTDTMQGVITYKGLQTQGDTLTLEYNGGLKKTSKSSVPLGGPGGFRGGPRGFGRGGPGGPGGFPRSPFDQPDFRGLVQSTNTIVMSHTGDVKNLRGDSQLPFLLGNLCLMPFEALPEDGAKEWQEGNGLTITSGSNSDSRFGPRFGPFANNNEEEKKTGGGETVAYRIQGDDGKSVTIAKTYTLSSPPATADDTGFAINGSGTYVFNRELGVPESTDMKMDLKVTSNNSDVKIPLTVAFKRMSDDEMAAHKKKVEEEKAALMLLATRHQRPLSPEEHKDAMERVQSKDEKVILKVLVDMNKNPRKEILKEDVEFMVHVGLLLNHDNEEIRKAAEVLWERWGTSVEKHASEDDKKRVAEAVKQHEEMAGNPFEVEGEDDGKGIRTWSDKSGRFKVEGEFQQLQGGMVVLKDKDGKTVRVPKARLSESDQKLIEKLSKK